MVVVCYAVGKQFRFPTLSVIWLVAVCCVWCLPSFADNADIQTVRVSYGSEMSARALSGCNTFTSTMGRSWVVTTMWLATLLSTEHQSHEGNSKESGDVPHPELMCWAWESGFTCIFSQPQQSAILSVVLYTPKASACSGATPSAVLTGNNCTEIQHHAVHFHSFCNTDSCTSSFRLTQGWPVTLHGFHFQCNYSVIYTARQPL